MHYHNWVPLAAQETTLELGVRRPSADEVAQARERLQRAAQGPLRSLEDIYAVIAYYLRRHPEIEAYLQRRHQEATEIRKQNEARFDPKGIRDLLLQHGADPNATDGHRSILRQGNGRPDIVKMLKQAGAK